MGDLNISLWGFLTFLCYMLIAGFLTRTVASMWPESALSKALLYIQ